MRKDRGITLIALVVTIIVLLILAGISISMLTGQNGILNRASEAKEKNEVVQLEEKVKIAVMSALTDGSGTLTILNLQKELKNQGISIIDGNDFPVVVNIEEKSYLIEQNGMVKSTNEISIPEGLEIGSIVTYSPSGTYNWQGKYCSSSEENKLLSSASGDDFNLIKWKVLSIENGKVKLVPINPTEGKVYLGQAQGYNNGVKLLNDACSSLYSSTGVFARSLNIDDIEMYMDDTKLAEVHEYQNTSGGAKYNTQISLPYINSKSYATIYENEKLSVINGIENKEGLKRSEQTNFIERNVNNIANDKKTADTSIQPYQTGWSKENSYMQTAFKKASNGQNYYDILIKSSFDYWLASRCVNTGTSECSFNIYGVYGGTVGSYGMFSSSNTNKGTVSLFPIISVEGNIIQKNIGNEFIINLN